MFGYVQLQTQAQTQLRDCGKEERWPPEGWVALDDLEGMVVEREKVLAKWGGGLLTSVMGRLTNQEKALCLGDE